MIDYQKILNQNLICVFKDILKNIKKNGLSNDNHLYVTFLTNHNQVDIPNWLKKKYPEEMTIIIQYEYYDLQIYKNYFLISLSFNNIKAKIKIAYASILSFADPASNFGLILQNKKSIIKKRKSSKKKKSEEKGNVISFSNFKNNYSK